MESNAVDGQPNTSPFTKAEKVERSESIASDLEDRPAKKIKIEQPPHRGVAPIKAEYLIDHSSLRSSGHGQDVTENPPNGTINGEKSNKKKSKGQNTNRNFGSSRDAIQLCLSRAKADEFAPNTCAFGDACKFEHDLRKYLKDGKREDLDTFGRRCPVFDARGDCSAGWRCRFVGFHSEERVLDDGRKELVLLSDVSSRKTEPNHVHSHDDDEFGVFNIVSAEEKIKLSKRQTKTPKSDLYSHWLNGFSKDIEGEEQENEKQGNLSKPAQNELHVDKQLENRAQYKEPPFLPSEKRRIYYGPETPILAPLTTQGNLPFRRLCVDLGAQVTWSEMAMGLPIVQGAKPEWALMKVHESEITPPKYTPKVPIIDSYDNAKDLKFGAQIAANKPWVALKTTEILTSLCPYLRAVDLNCGCPIDLVYRQGAGSALLDSPGKLEKILRGMNAVSGEVPITVKIRTGTRDNKPTATRLVSRLAFGGPEADQLGLGPAGVAAIALHGRSRQQRYTRSADWEYISECAAVIQNYRSQRDSLADTINSPDPRHLASSGKQTTDTNSGGGNIYFVGNGDVFSHTDYFDHLNPIMATEKNSQSPAAVDAVMIARGALIKPWIFEEIAQGQHLDKSSSERLHYIESFARYGLQTWGSDEIGVGTTRRFLLEWLSFACRYVPVGMLEYLPPRIQDRSPAFKGRDELESLLSSDNYRDWIKISEMFLGPAHKDFKFEPKHKSNMTAEG